MKIRNIYRLGVFALAAASLSACSFLDTDPKIIDDENYYNSEQKLIYGLAGIYGAISSEELYGNYYSLQVANADDLCYFNNYNSSDSRPDRYNFNSGNSTIYSVWAKLYEGVKNANRYITSVEKAEIDPANLSNSIDSYLAEARFLRAYYHFLLAQTWGDVPLRTVSTISPNPEDVQMAATPQADILKWCTEEIEAVMNDLSDQTDQMPSRVNQATAQGILARIYLFMAGATVKEIDGLSKSECYRRAAEAAKTVIESNRYHLNPDYSEVFTNMISDQYDTQYHESMWEAEFLGDRTSATSWSNGRIGDLIGLKSQSSVTNYSEWACNYSYGYYNGSYTLWQLYWDTDRTTEEASNATEITDARQAWNLPGYNFAGFDKDIKYTKDGASVTEHIYQAKSMYATPYNYNNYFATTSLEGLDASQGNTFDTAYALYDPTLYAAARNAGKWRRETIYEKQMSAKSLYTTINFPILRYADVLLMYAEAINEYAGAPDELAKESLREVRTRAGIKTDESQLSDYRSFRDLLRNERGRELAFEGLRKWDLIRWGTFVEAMHNAGTNVPTENKYLQASMVAYATANYSNVVARHIYLPIPTKELAVNHLLKQNTLW